MKKLLLTTLLSACLNFSFADVKQLPTVDYNFNVRLLTIGRLLNVNGGSILLTSVLKGNHVVITDIIISHPSAPILSTIGFGWDDNCTNVSTPAHYFELANTDATTRVTIKEGAPLGHEGQNLCMRPDVVQSSFATVDIDVIGYELPY